MSVKTRIYAFAAFFCFILVALVMSFSSIEEKRPRIFGEDWDADTAAIRVMVREKWDAWEMYQINALYADIRGKQISEDTVKILFRNISDIARVMEEREFVMRIINLYRLYYDIPSEERKYYFTFRDFSRNFYTGTICSFFDMYFFVILRITSRRIAVFKNMNKKVLYSAGALMILGIAAFFVLGAVEKNKEKNPLAVENNSSISETGAWTTVKNGTYAVSVSESQVGWEGKKTLIKDYVDTGTLAVKDGSIRILEGNVTAEIVFDMTSIKAHSTGSGKGESGLERHLKSDDFFSVEAFPTSVFLVERVVPLDNEAHSYTATGKLTIKGITNEISVPVLLYELDGAVRVDGTALIDRTKWDIRFGSDKFFDNLANNVIDDFFSVSFSVVAR